jgi:hypothetical protein
MCGTTLNVGVDYLDTWDTNCEAANNHNLSMCSDERYFTTSTSDSVTETKVKR